MTTKTPAVALGEAMAYAEYLRGPAKDAFGYSKNEQHILALADEVERLRAAFAKKGK